MKRSVPFALACMVAACAGPDRRAADEELTLLAVFEAIQAKGGKARGFVMVDTAVDGKGTLQVFRSGVEPMDRFIQLWGEDGPQVPVSFSAEGAALFSILHGHTVLDQDLSEAEAAEWTWKKLHETFPEKVR